MPDYLLRVEGINQSHFITDCQELSTVRGGSLLLLAAVKTLTANVTGLEPVSLGASVGLFKFQSPDAAAAEAVRSKVRTHLRTHAQYRHATFAADVVPETADFPKDVERVTAKNRRWQWAEPSLSLDHLYGTAAADACAVDLVRPATDKTWIARVEKNVSASVKIRHAHGQDQKRQLYEDETKITGLTYVSTLEDLTMRFPKKTTIPGNLYGKMAVIYLDGNDFGKTQRLVCKDDKLLKTWDIYLRGCRQALMKALVQNAKADPTWKADGHIRLETLLWGGDEIIWVVPAWKAFETLTLMAAQSSGWKLPNDLDPTEPPLTLAVGVVICSHKAPIHRMTRLADDLAGLAKSKSKTENLVAVETLESFDHVGPDVTAFRAGNTPKRSADESAEERAKRTVLSLNDIAAIRKHIAALKANAVDFPRRKHHELVQALLRNGSAGTDMKTLGAAITAPLPQAARDAWAALAPLLGGEDTAWALLWQLWDYIGEDKRQ